MRYQCFHPMVKTSNDTSESAVVGVYLATILSKKFCSQCFLVIDVSYLLSYLVLETSYYTNKQFTALESLDAYN